MPAFEGQLLPFRPARGCSVTAVRRCECAATRPGRSSSEVDGPGELVRSLAGERRAVPRREPGQLTRPWATQAGTAHACLWQIEPAPRHWQLRPLELVQVQTSAGRCRAARRHAMTRWACPGLRRARGRPRPVLVVTAAVLQLQYSQQQQPKATDVLLWQMPGDACKFMPFLRVSTPGQQCQPNWSPRKYSVRIAGCTFSKSRRAPARTP